jgi:hypothetical protein
MHLELFSLLSIYASPFGCGGRFHEEINEDNLPSCWFDDPLCGNIDHAYLM